MSKVTIICMISITQWENNVTLFIDFYPLATKIFLSDWIRISPKVWLIHTWQSNHIEWTLKSNHGMFVESPKTDQGINKKLFQYSYLKLGSIEQ